MPYQALLDNAKLPGFTDPTTRFKDGYEPETKCGLAEVFEVTSM